MKKAYTCLLVISTALGVSLVGYSQTPTPVPVYKTYATAMSAGNTAAAANKRDVAVDAFRQASDLAAGDPQKADALIEVAKVEMENFHTGTTGGKFKGTNYTVYHHAMAVKALNSALELAAITDAKRAEIKLLRADVYERAMRNRNTYNSLATDLEKQYKKGIKDLIYTEIAALTSATATPPDIKARAQILKARTYEISSGAYVSSSDMKWAFDALAAAADTAGAADPIKAEALFKIVEIATKANDANVYASAYERITLLPKAEPTQKFKAFSGLGSLLVLNNRFEPARQFLNDGLKIAGLSTEERAVLYRQIGGTYFAEIQTSKPEKAAADKMIATARAEFAKAVNQPKLSPDEKSALCVGNAVYIRRFKEDSYFSLAHEQLRAALAVPKATEKAKAIAQYHTGETIRIAKNYTEARKAFTLVTKADAQYYGYAQQRIKALDSPTQITNISDDDIP